MRPASTVALLLVLVSHAWGAPRAAAQVTLVVGSATGAPAGVQVVPISITGGAGVGAVQFDLRFDAADLEVTSVTQEILLADAVFGWHSPAPGRVRVAAALSRPIDADGVLVTAVVVQKPGGAGAVLTLADARAWRHADNVEIPAQTARPAPRSGATSRGTQRGDTTSTLTVPSAGTEAAERGPALQPAVVPPVRQDVASATPPGQPKNSVAPVWPDASTPATGLDRLVPAAVGVLGVLDLALFGAVIVQVRRRRRSTEPSEASMTLGRQERPGFCTYCGTPAHAGGRYCRSCGSALG